MMVEDVEDTPRRAWLVGLAAWFVPGLGHLMVNRWGRALLMGGAVWLCFFLGLAMGGRLNALASYDGPISSFLLAGLLVIGNFGTGSLYLVCWLFDYGFAEDIEQARRVTHEYGYIFLHIAGLLNFLTMLDAFDIAAGRKS
ncbi:MAG TPA: DUF6677 family protein [Pyrinomonadaceae bacterium]|nr:DUF6677 family protein [Pyrinomonadaceae bacterium]